MNKPDFNPHKLPPTRTGWILRWIDSQSWKSITFFGALVYLSVIFCVSIIEFLEFCLKGRVWVVAGTRPVQDFWEIVYFNCITILTIGYGDLVPNGAGARFVSVAEAFLGTAIISTTLGALILKLVAPERNSVIFSKYAYYCVDKEQFMVIYLNTTDTILKNADLSSYFKLGGDWLVRPAVRSPLITRSVQTFLTDEVPIVDLVEKLIPEFDCLRFGISGQIGSATFSEAVQYDVEDIIVLGNRDQLTAYPGFWEVQFGNPELNRMFHYRPPQAMTLGEYVEQRRKATGGT